MSVRMAIVKLSAVVAGGALIGGGAVHMAEKVAAGKAHYVKHAKAPAHHLAKKATARAKATEVAAASCQTVNCLPHEDLAVVPMPAPNLPPQAEPAPPAAETDGYQEFGGPHGGGYYSQLGGGGVVVIDRNGHRHIRPGPPPPNPGPTPAPPMLVLFGLAAATLMGRRALAQRMA